MTLSCTHLRWSELFQVLARIQDNDLADKQVDALSCNERCQMININPAVVVKNFQYRVETFFTLLSVA